MTELLTLTHLAAFALGVATWLPFTLWEGRRVTTNSKGQNVTMDDDTTGQHTSIPRSKAVAVLGIVVSLLVVGMGVQQYLFQQQQDHAAAAQKTRDQRDRDRQACYEKWGHKLVATVKTRTDATKRLELASTDRNNSVDNVVLFVFRSRTADPPLTPAQAASGFDAVLRNFVAAKTHLEAVTRHVQTTRRHNPYPVLHCSGDPSSSGGSSRTPSPNGGR